MTEGGKWDFQKYLHETITTQERSRRRARERRSRVARRAVIALIVTGLATFPVAAIAMQLNGIDNPWLLSAGMLVCATMLMTMGRSCWKAQFASSVADRATPATTAATRQALR